MRRLSVTAGLQLSTDLSTLTLNYHLLLSDPIDQQMTNAAIVCTKETVKSVGLNIWSGL
ncbi:hypothetical protein OIDMADRAFT_20559 [Oidiodendron maius Zn]|uniref:Uncharacterized protein n=1 Tax=Oidiodendron maius (strain Zn) TaxID=913774 RepID=A0A0C3GMT0_OIDMZ|nr:hypothetical protein OIDMADRAFT_20559 [Oidiodendron maius Zn]